ncbi:MAG: nicotinate (nicotinamide) nucleotide adenylyltransferase [Bdellovibrionales bacterium]|nr:nicotinate (nicotinamide) nucleotide adenylyltransferase [Ramlibacter sp.]
MQRLGIFGGAFDPPHDAHVALINAAVAQLQLDELRVFPTGQAWHKPRELTAAEDRLAMARLAFGGLPRVVVDDREIRRAGPTYTIDTVHELQTEFPGVSFYIVLGADQAAKLPGWRQWREIMQLATLSIAGRLESDSNSIGFDISTAPLGRFETLQLPPTSISATDIRQRVSASKGIAHLVPGGVARYIDQHHLYLAS